jgi:hypothetical protein
VINGLPAGVLAMVLEFFFDLARPLILIEKRGILKAYKINPSMDILKCYFFNTHSLFVLAH